MNPEAVSITAMAYQGCTSWCSLSQLLKCQHTLELVTVPHHKLRRKEDAFHEFESVVEDHSLYVPSKCDQKDLISVVRGGNIVGEMRCVAGTNNLVLNSPVASLLKNP